MTKSRRQALILAGLIVVMAAVYAHRLHQGRPSQPVAVSEPDAPGDAHPPSAGMVALNLPEAMPARQAQHDLASRLAWGRDPFTGGSTGAEVSGFDLSGILWDPTQPIAVINGQMLRMGDELEGYKVTKIAQDSVSLSDGSQTVTLAISQ